MPVIISTNIAAQIAANNLAYSSQSLQRSLNRLSSGSKLASPADDAGGLAVAMKLSATANRESSLQSNLGDTASYAQTQDGGLQVAGSILDRISQLATLYTDPTKNTSDLANYNDEFGQLQKELTALGSQTFNGINLFGTASLTVAGTDDLSSSGAISVAQQDLLGTSGFAPLTENFSDLSRWATSGTVSVGGGNLALSGSDVLSTATSHQAFTGPMQINFDVTVPGTGDTFTVRHGSDVLAHLVGAGNITRSAWHSVKITLGADGSASTYLDASTTALQTSAGLGTGAAALSFSDFGAGAARMKNLSVTSGTASSNMAAVAGAADLGSLSLSTITGAIQYLATARAENGAEQSRLNFASTLLTVNRTNLQAAVSNISDVDVAQETTRLAKWNVLVQAGTSMLAQANQSAQTALKLITG